MSDLTKDDWQYILYAVEERWRRADPKKGEPASSDEYENQKGRIRRHLFRLAYPREETQQ